ncbi:ankyrin repeat family protein [Euphorbia peplus]|nr:ankyrin repeat family protein [Euphorbia peplus]
MADGSGNDEMCRTRLLMAARCGQLDCVKRLADDLDRGQGLRLILGSIIDKDGRTVFHHAAIAGNTHVCKYLLDELQLDHLNLRDRTLGETPLHQAIMAGHCTTAVYFIEKGANPNIATDAGDTPLHYAVMKGHTKLVHMLISKGADVNAKSDSTTPLLWAASFGNKKAMKLLLDNNANPDLIHLPAPSPLMESVLSGSYECVKLLLQAGADPNMVGGGVTVLHAAASEGVDIEIIKCLLDWNANPNAVDARGLTPIEIAALNDHHEIFKILLPLTSPFPSIYDWSYDGIMYYLISDKPLKQREKKRKELLKQLKAKGEYEVKRKEYTNAVYWYIECYVIEPLDATILSNLSFCWARLNNGCGALSCAQDCVSLRPDWPKAHYREGVAWNLLKHFPNAAKSFLAGLQLDPQNEELSAAFREALLKARRGPE